MKKRVKGILLAAVALSVLCSCGGKKDSAVGESESPVKSSVSEKKAETVETVDSVVIYPEGPIWTMNKDGKMEWKKSFRAGKVLKAVKKNGSSVNVKAIRTSDNQEREFFEIVYEGEKCYVQDGIAVFNTVPGAVFAYDSFKVFTYNSADENDIAGVKLQDEVVCAIDKEGSEGDFYLVTFYYNKKYYEKLYIKKEDVNTVYTFIDLISLRKAMAPLEAGVLRETLGKCEGHMENPVDPSRPFKETLINSDKKDAVILLQDNGDGIGSLWKKDKDDNLVWSANIPTGTVLDGASGPKTYTRLNDGEKKEFEFYKVKYKKNESYVMANRVVPYNGREAFILEKAVVFNEANPCEFSKTILEPETIVEIIGKVERDISLDMFKIRYYSRYTVQEGYVLCDSVSSDPDDTKALMLYKKAAGEKDADIKEQLLKSAGKKAVSDYMKKKIAIDLGEDANVADDMSSVDFTDSVEVSKTYTVATDDGSNLNVREFPPDGPVIGQFENGAEVVASRKSNATSTIGGITASWFYVSQDDGLSGWVFGAFLGE